jgi:YD repeat-containing protein
VSRPTIETRTIVTGGAVVSTTWDENGRLHVRVDIDGIPDSRLIDDAVPLDISVGDDQVFPPVSDDDEWDDEL